MESVDAVAPGVRAVARGLDPAVARMKARLLEARYEICLARALHFTRVYRATEGKDPAVRNAMDLQRVTDSLPNGHPGAQG